MNRRSDFVSLGSFILVISSIFFWMGSIPEFEMRNPRNSISFERKTHFSLLSCREFSFKTPRIVDICCSWSSAESEKIIISSIYAAANASKPCNMESMWRWNIWAAFRNPKGIVWYSNRPNGVVIAVFWTSSGCIAIWWKAFFKSKVEKYNLLAILSIISAILGNGYLSGFVISFKSR